MTMTLRASTTRHAHPRHHSQRSLPNRVIPLTQWHQGCAGPAAGPGSRFSGTTSQPAEKEKPKTVNISARNRDVDREVAASRSSPGYPGQVPGEVLLGGGGLAVMDRLTDSAPEVAPRCAGARRVNS